MNILIQNGDRPNKAETYTSNVERKYYNLFTLDFQENMIK